MTGATYTFPLLSFARLLVPSIKFVKYVIRMNSAAILHVKIVWYCNNCFGPMRVIRRCG